jgi:hypothetical protein
MAVVYERPADREQPEGREMVVGDAASDRRVRDVDEESSHARKVRRAAPRDMRDV